MKEIDNRISIIAKACDDRKAFDLKILNIGELTSMADYFVIASGNSTGQVVGIIEEIEEKMKKAGYELYGKEGYKTARWILLDFGDIVVHVFHKEEREFYNLEKLWADGEELVI